MPKRNQTVAMVRTPISHLEGEAVQHYGVFQRQKQQHIIRIRSRVVFAHSTLHPERCFCMRIVPLLVEAIKSMRLRVSASTCCKRAQ
jgi:hypothetical protein